MEYPPLEKYVGIDCETVSVRGGSALAKVAIIDYKGEVLLLSHVWVHPKNVVSWVTNITGLKPGDLDGAPTFEQIQPKIEAVLEGKIIIGHAVFNDLAAIQHQHPYEDVRDTALYYPLRKLMGIDREGELPSLKKMTAKVLGKEIQGGVHDPIEDAKASIDIFLTVREEYETLLAKGGEISGMPPSYAKWYW
ncbi:ribonuclease H-like domain-containing protein [Dioszegia hungarica]|uniref:Ribonuclease H-like domain-containing protein n=1 Tax=Dioszegia hungarica TaxID=4972 RepID=A0AA38HGH0_9TREE|nr:ribonuclease H-like domain-containing protein [Dioszegia hungarica]KAI9639094.1 ribonuclease H-like domain-containing protein [Dioszegia hungarica]